MVNQNGDPVCMPHTDAELHMHKGYHVPTKQTSARSSSPEWQLGVDVLLFVEQG